MSGDRPKRRAVPFPATGDLPRVGKVRLGVQVDVQGREGVTRPKATDYFVVTADDAGVTTAESAESFLELYPGEPRILRCILPAVSAEQVFEGAWRLYGTGKLKRKCDGQECDERTATGGWETQPCVCQAQDIPEEVQHSSGNMVKNPAHCRLIYTLNVFLPGVQGVGVWQVETQSPIGARKIANWLRMMEGMTADLRGLPFELHLVPVQVAPGGKTKTVHVLEPRATAETQLWIGERGRKQLEAGEPQAALPEPAADGDDADYADVEEVPYDDAGDTGDPIDQDPGPEQEQEQAPAPPPPAPPAGGNRLEELKAMPAALHAQDPERFQEAHLAVIRQAVTAHGIPWKLAALADDATWNRVKEIVEETCLVGSEAQQTIGGAA